MYIQYFDVSTEKYIYIIVDSTYTYSIHLNFNIQFSQFTCAHTKYYGKNFNVFLYFYNMFILLQTYHKIYFAIFCDFQHFEGIFILF